jgi:IclR family mhp operon transcriptional activator
MADDAVRSVARALQLMQALQRLEAASLAALQAECGLPKPTLLRLLHTLEAGRVAWRAAGDGLWRPAFELRPTQIRTPAHQRLIAAALPPLEDLRRSVVWPSDLAVREGRTMLLLETTRRASGLAVNRDEIGHRIDLLRSAVGRAWLSAAPPAETARLARALARPLAATVQRQGYAEREAGFGGHDEPIDRFDDQLAAIAVPVCDGARVLGAINIVWLKRFDAKAALVGRHLAELQRTAAQIALRWRQKV